MTVFHHVECRNGEKRKRQCCGRLVLYLHGIKSNRFTLFRPHLSHSHINGVPLLPDSLRPIGTVFCHLAHRHSVKTTRHSGHLTLALHEIKSNLFPLKWQHVRNPPGQGFPYWHAVIRPILSWTHTGLDAAAHRHSRQLYCNSS